jgi:hypothetical protein
VVSSPGASEFLLGGICAETGAIGDYVARAESSLFEPL